ncbi:Nucleoporin nup84 [Scheffersomyces spartinae]|uniref:Nuclear pore complex protein n=1 Tax=Scheffersomyces spartinae TaxID=45513 RepID=A0A9P7V694_9ASCO|nr:Nucleoporin nup84 [Scheffersomyces spartinae]KAG7191984.1 Nucleoporin nup84 [Scheffersomyces spartinae]
MEVNSVNEGLVESLFALVLEQFQVEPKTDPLKLVLEFKSIAAQNALEAQNVMLQNPEDDVIGRTFDNWDLETKMWNLVELLYGFRAQQQKSSSLYGKSDKELKIKELELIVSWIQTNTSIVEEDEGDDDGHDVFKTVYKMILANQLQDAIDLANNTGNYSLALILVGAATEHNDPFDNSSGGVKHKILWKQTVYKLSQQSTINYYEKLIYNYLCGGDITENLKESSNDWEKSLLLYTNQLFVSKYGDLLEASDPEERKQSQSISYEIPLPQISSIEKALTVLLKSNNPVSELSTHPIRIIEGTLIINKVGTFLSNVLSDYHDELVTKSFLLRIVVHLAIIDLLLAEEPDHQVITELIKLYISQLTKENHPELVPIYLSYIPNEADSRELYSMFLSSITDPEQRSRQVQIARKFANFELGLTEEYSNSDKLVNTLRRTVERVLEETSNHYQPDEDIVLIRDHELDVDAIDYKMYRTVDWFYENSMHEDAVIATIVVLKRFLLKGKFAAIKKFCQDKDLTRLRRDFDAENQVKSLAGEATEQTLVDTYHLELKEFNDLVNGLRLIDDWKRSINETSQSWKLPSMDLSIEKVSNTVLTLINSWLLDLINEGSSTDLYHELRSIVIPFLCLELITIYEHSRLSDWKYIYKALRLINAIADDTKNDLMECFRVSGKLNELLNRIGQLSVVAIERGTDGLY